MVKKRTLQEWIEAKTVIAEITQYCEICGEPLPVVLFITYYPPTEANPNADIGIDALTNLLSQHKKGHQ